MSNSSETVEQLDAELANLCAQLLKMALTAAQAHAALDGKPGLAERLGLLAEARLVVHAYAHDLRVELLAPAEDGDGTVSLFALEANASPWTLQ